MLFLSTSLLQWRLRGLRFDDALIHLRVARNLAHHGVATFNPGERVMTTSSPLWTLLLTGLRVYDHPDWLAFIEAALLTACGILTYQLARRLSPGASEESGLSSVLSGVVAGALSIMILLPSSVGQMETPLAIALALGWLLCMTCRRSGSLLALPLLALAACTRLEFLPLLAIASVTTLVLQRSVRPVVAPAAVVGAMAIFVYMQFGTLLPNSMHAKAVGYTYSRMDIVQQIFEAPFLEVPLAICLSVVLVGMTIDRMHASRGEALPTSALIPYLSGLSAVFAMLEYVLRKTPIFGWYRPLIWIPWLLCLLLGRTSRSSPLGLRLTVEPVRFVALVLLLFFPFWRSRLLLRSAIEQTAFAQAAVDRGDGARVRQYLAIGQVLRTNCPGSSLMTSEIGALGWSFGGYVDDAFGIATPRALAFQPLRSGAPVGGIPARFAAEILPDIIVSYTTLDVEVRNDPALMDQYQLIELPPSLPADRTSNVQPGWHGSKHLDVLLRKQGSCSGASVQQALSRAELQAAP